MMKHRLSFWSAFLAAALFWNCAGFKAAPPAPRYKPGYYEGAAPGFRGPVRLWVQVDAAGIADLEILDHQEDEQIGGIALEELRDLVLDTGATDIDAVSGATESSAAFLAALEEALTQAEVGP
jgi:fumarate reductase flavoprotein subunit